MAEETKTSLYNAINALHQTDQAIWSKVQAVSGTIGLENLPDDVAKIITTEGKIAKDLLPQTGINLSFNGKQVGTEITSLNFAGTTTITVGDDGVAKIQIGDYLSKIPKMKLEDQIVKIVNVDSIISSLKGIVGTTSLIFDAFVTFIVSIYLLLERSEIKAFLAKVAEALFDKKTNRTIARYYNKTNNGSKIILFSLFLNPSKYSMANLYIHDAAPVYQVHPPLPRRF